MRGNLEEMANFANSATRSFAESTATGALILLLWPRRTELCAFNSVFFHRGPPQKVRSRAGYIIILFQYPRDIHGAFLTARVDRNPRVQYANHSVFFLLLELLNQRRCVFFSMVRHRKRFDQWQDSCLYLFSERYQVCVC